MASGFTLRGLAFTEDPRYTYIESDLTGISTEKKAIISSLRQKYGLADHANLHFPTVNALDRDQLREAVKRLNRDEPLVVVNEGLFQYLSPDEMGTVVGNIANCWPNSRAADYTGFFDQRRGQPGSQAANFRRIVAEPLTQYVQERLRFPGAINGIA